MALATNPTYSTYAQFQTYTPVESQKDVLFTEAMWKPFALMAEKIVDTYCTVPEAIQFSQDQNLKFPIYDDNGNSWLPDDVTLATIYITSDLILKGDPLPTSDFVESESWSSSGYSVSKQKKSTSATDDIKMSLPPLARRLLMPWTNKVASLKY